jgi:hypothetical protein
MVSSAKACTRRYSATTSSRLSSAVAHMSALSSASSSIHGSTSYGRSKVSPK